MSWLFDHRRVEAVNAIFARAHGERAAYRALQIMESVD